MVRRQLHPKPIFDEGALRSFLLGHGAKEVHLLKIWKHLLAEPECPLDQIPGIPEHIRSPLKEEFVVLSSKVAEVSESKLDETVKLLIRLQDGSEVEAVLIRHTGETEDPAARQAPRCGQRETLCVSSQVGCKLGCTFCATGTMGLQGNLWSGEILEQLIHARKLRPVSNVVFMGMGEPLENYDSVTAAIRSLVDPQTFGVAPSSITVSTVGIVNNMRRFMNDLPKVRLAWSLHAPTQELREKIVPIGRVFKLDSLMEVLDEYAERNVKGKGSVMVSYVLLAAVNDTDECAQQLINLVRGRPVIVNLIPYNSFEENSHGYKTPSPERVDAFLAALQDADIRVFHRRHHGRDIAAACGQLAKKGTANKTSDVEDCGSIFLGNGQDSSRAKAHAKLSSDVTAVPSEIACGQRLPLPRSNLAIAASALVLLAGLAICRRCSSSS
mmetsp:Transcript_89917/g.196801  ORF Transcript_89917/g.196801 Transcript_89917/m.196801 type:complete len:441 (-) Transcript_89917:142-1464(-)